LSSSTRVQCFLQFRHLQNCDWRFLTQTAFCCWVGFFLQEVAGWAGSVLCWRLWGHLWYWIFGRVQRIRFQFLKSYWQCFKSRRLRGYFCWFWTLKSV